VSIAEKMSVLDTFFALVARGLMANKTGKRKRQKMLCMEAVFASEMALYWTSVWLLSRGSYNPVYRLKLSRLFTKKCIVINLIVF
jgi:hypothetical protein